MSQQQKIRLERHWEKLRKTFKTENYHTNYLNNKTKNKIRIAFARKMSTGIKLSKAQLSKIIQSGGFLGALLGKFADPLMKVMVL